MEISAITDRVGERLRARRKALGWSLDRCATATGVSKAMLGQIERGESSPTIATLWKIATGVQASFSSFLTPEPSAGRTESFEHDPNMQVKTLFHYDATTGFEVFEITLRAQHTQLSTPHQPGVLEHIHVLEGEISLLIDGDWKVVSKGEQCILPGDTAHGYRGNTETARFIDIIHYPAGGDGNPFSTSL